MEKNNLLNEMKNFQKIQEEYLKTENLVNKNVKNIFKIWNELFSGIKFVYFTENVPVVIEMDKNNAKFTFRNSGYDEDGYTNGDEKYEIPLKFIEKFPTFKKGYEESLKVKELYNGKYNVINKREEIKKSYIIESKYINKELIEKTTKEKNYLDKKLNKKIQEYKNIKDSETLKELKQFQDLSNILKEEIIELQKQQNIYKSQLKKVNYDSFKILAESKYQKEYQKEYEMEEVELKNIDKKMKKHQSRVNEIKSLINDDYLVSTSSHLV